MSMSRICFVAMLLGGLLAGCGQSGPLYLPGNPSAVQTEASRTTPVESVEIDADEAGETGGDAD